MADPLSISMLLKKAEQIRDTIVSYEKKLREAQADLAHVNAALRLFAASGEPEDFPPYLDLNRVFRRGETTAFCFAVLKAEGPLDMRELTYRLMKHKGLDTNDKVLSETIALRVVQAMRVHAKRGNLDGSQKRKNVCLWKLNEAGFMPRVANSLSTGAIPGASELRALPVNTAPHC